MKYVVSYYCRRGPCLQSIQVLERIAIEPLEHGVGVNIVIVEYVIVVHVGFFDVLPFLIYIQLCSSNMLYTNYIVFKILYIMSVYCTCV